MVRVTWDADSRGSAEITPDLGGLVGPCHTPAPSGLSSSGILNTFCLSQAYESGKQSEFGGLFKNRLSKTMMHSKMSWLEKITMCFSA